MPSKAIFHRGSYSPGCRRRHHCTTHFQPHIEPLLHAQLLLHIESDSSALTTRVAPILSANSSRYGFTSVTTACGSCVTSNGGGHGTDRTAACHQYVLAQHGKAEGGWVALPKGSKMAATSLTPALWTHTLVWGRDMYSAKAPGRVTPMPAVSEQRCRPRHAVSTAPQTTWPPR